MNLPGRFDPHVAKSIFAPNVDWPIGRIKSRVEQAIGLPVVVDNVANACAFLRSGSATATACVILSSSMSLKVLELVFSRTAACCVVKLVLQANSVMYN